VLNNTIYNFLNQQELELVWQDLSTANWRYVPMSGGQMHWNFPVMSLTDNSNNSIEWYQDTPNSIKLIYNKFKDFFGDHLLTRLVINGQNYGMDSGIHRDSINPKDSTCLIYLNPSWDLLWQGQTRFFNNNILIHEEIPEPGKMLVYSSSIYHQGLAPALKNLLRVTLAIQVKPAKYVIGEL
jgi:hypothetical protein